MKKSLLILGLMLSLTACASQPPASPSVQTDQTALLPLNVDTQDVRVINRAYAIPQTPPYIGHLFTPTMIEAVDEWAKNRLHASGAAGHTAVIIKDASLTERPVVMDDGLTSFMWRQQGKKYIGRIEVAIEAQSPINGTASATANAVHSVTLPEDPTEEEKSVAYQKLMTAIMRDLEISVQQAMQDHMSRFLLKSEPPAPLPPAAPTVSSGVEPGMAAPASLLNAPDAVPPPPPVLIPPDATVIQADDAPVVISAPEPPGAPTPLIPAP